MVLIYCAYYYLDVVVIEICLDCYEMCFWTLDTVGMVILENSK